MHSTTKYLNGHSDMVGGALVVGGETRSCAEQLAFLQNAVGARRRAVRQSSSRCAASRRWRCAWSGTARTALQIARWLEARSRRARGCIYPGLASHPQHALAKRQMRAFGGMITVDLEGGGDEARRLLERCSCSRSPRASAASKA